MDPIFEKNLIPTKKASELSGYTSDYLARLARSGKISARRVGHAWFVDSESLRHFLDQQGDRKIDYARALARARELEYRTIHSQVHQVKSALTRPLQVPGKIKIIADVLRPQMFAVSLSIIVIASGAFVAKAMPSPEFVNKITVAASDIAYGFEETFGDIPSRVVAKIKKVEADMHSFTPRAAADLTLSFPTDYNFSSLRISLQDEHSASRAAFVPNYATTTANYIQPSISDAYTFITNPSRIINLLARAYISIGNSAYGAAISSLDFYRSLVEISGAKTLSFASYTRDTIAIAPQQSAEAVVTLIRKAGNLLVQNTARLPALATTIYLRATEAPAIIAPAVAGSVFNAEYEVSLRLVMATQDVSGAYIVAITGIGRFYYESTLALNKFGETMPSALSAGWRNTYLATLGKSAASLDSFARTPKVAAVISATHSATEPLLAAAAPAFSTIEQIALATYKSIQKVFNSTSRSLATIFAPAPSIIVPDGVLKPRTAATTLQVNTPPTYTTIVNGVSEDFVNQSLTSLRNSVLATVAGMIQPVSRQVINNSTTIQQVSRIEDLSNLIVRNGDFRGSIFDSGIRVSATSGNFTTLIGGATTLATTTVTGNLAVSGTITPSIISASTSISAPYFIATSTTATSTFAGSLNIDNGALVYATSTRNFGISTTTPGTALAVEGSSLLGNSATAGYFTATTSTASQFPYASSTAITVSGTASTSALTVSNQATLGSLTLSTSLAVTSGGTGLASVADGSLLFGSGSTALTALATTSGAGRFLSLDFTTGRPSWTATSSLGIALSDTTGTLAVARGGTGVTTSTGTGSVVLSASPTFTGLASFANASSTLFSNFGTAYFGATATSSFSSAGALTLASALGVGSGGTGVTATSSLGIALSDTTGTLAVARGGTNLTSYTLNQLLYASGTGTIGQIATSSLGLAISDTTGTLAVARGGTGVTTSTGTGSVVLSASPTFTGTANFANLTLTGNASTTLLSSYGPAYFGSTATSSFNSAGALTLATPLAVTSGGTGVTATSSLGIALSDTTGTLAVARGGTNLTSYTLNQLLYASGTGTIGQIATSSLGLAISDTTGTLAVLRGGTGVTTSTGTGSVVLSASPTFTGLASFANASSTLFSNTGTAYFGSTATSSFSSAGALTLITPLLVGSGGTGVTATSSLGIALSDTTGTLAVARGGTNLTSYTLNQLLYASGTGTIGQIATSSLGLAISDTTGTLAVLRGGTGVTTSTGTGSVVLSASPTFTGTANFANASSTLFSNFGTAYFGGTATSSFSSAGALTLITPLLVGSGGTGVTATSSLGIALSDTTGTLAVNRGGTNLTSYTLNQLLYASGTGTIGQIATSSLGVALSDTTGTLAVARGGTGVTTSTGTGSVVLSASPTFTGLASFANASSTLFSNFGTAYFGGSATSSFSSAGALTLITPLLVGSGGTGVTATSSLGIALSDTTGTLAVNRGGTNLTSYTLNQLLYASGTGTIGQIATSSLGLAISDTTGTLAVARGGTGATTFGQGWLFSAGGTGALSASTSPTVNYLVSTSTTATSTFAAGLQSTYLNITGTSATSTFANGIQLSAGCFRLADGTCAGTGGGGSGTVNTGTTGQTAFYAANGTALTATSTIFLSTSGNVGIGTSTPNWLFQVAGTRPSLALSDTSAGANLKHWLFSSMGGNLYIGTSTDAYATSTPAALTISNAGNIGIGTTSPGSILSVQGVGNFTTATSTFTSTGGINLTGGCFAINGTCLALNTTNFSDAQKNITLLSLKSASSTEQATTTILIDGIADSFSNTSGIDTTNSINLVTSTAGQVIAATTTLNPSTFTSSGTYVVPTGVTLVEYLVVAGGGGGGSLSENSVGAGGGGAGGFRTGNLAVTPGASLTVTVGAGGSGAQTPTNGSNSVFDSITATGGGAGGYRAAGAYTGGGNGGSGGGGINTTSGGTGTAGQGFGGGNTSAVDPFRGGGGGGASAAGTAGGDSAGTGGNGTASSISGSSVTYGGGGGGGIHSTGSAGAGGSGGGGAGGATNSTGTAGTANTGGGGGGSGSGTGGTYPSSGGNGGSGIVIVASTTPKSITLLSRAFTATTTPNSARLAIQAASTASFALNTDLMAAVSRDGGTTWATTTLVQLGSDLEDGTKLYGDTNINISSQPSGTSMKYRVLTANSKAITIYGVVFQWGAATGADLAENYPVADPSIGAGEIVSFDGVNPIFVKRAEIGDNRPLAGVISTQPGLLLSDKENATDQRPVALSGRVPTKVNLESGEIAIGDRVGLSSVPGVGKRASLFEASVGVALENYTATSTSGMVIVFVNLQSGVNINAIGEGLLSFGKGLMNTIGSRLASGPLTVSGGIDTLRTVDLTTPVPMSYATGSTTDATLSASTTAAVLGYLGLIPTALKAIQELDVRTSFITSAATTTVLTVSEGKLTVSGNVFADSYETTLMSATGFTTNSTTIVAEIPSAVLTADGEGVDLYKLATYTLSGVQALASTTAAHEVRITALEKRVDALESGAISTASGSPIAIGTSSLVSAFSDLGVLIQKGIAQFNTLVFRTLVASKDEDGTSSAGSVTLLAGNTVAQVNNSIVIPSTKIFVTFNSQITGSWWVSDKLAGSFRVVLSEAQVTDVSFDYFLVQTEGALATSTPPTTANSQQPTANSSGADTTAPVITLLGDNPRHVSVGEIFVDPGITVVDDTDTSPTYTTFVNGIEQPVSSIDTGSQTTYIITYSATDKKGNSATATRSIIIGSSSQLTADSGQGNSSASSQQQPASPGGDTSPPVITLLGDNPVHVSVGGVFIDPGITVVDDTDTSPTYITFVNGIEQPVSSIDTESQTTYIITYSATDKKGNSATATRSIIVGNSLQLADSSEQGDSSANGQPQPASSSDVTMPVVTLTSDAALQVDEGQTFADPGATASDPSTELGAGDIDLTANIVVTGTVDTATAGLYTLTYTATDAAGNIGSASRLVTVIASSSTTSTTTTP